MHKSAQKSVTTLTEDMSALVAAVTPGDCKCCGDGASGSNATDGNSTGANSTRAEEEEGGEEAEATQRRRHRQTYAASRRAEGKDEMKSLLEDLLRVDTDGGSMSVRSGRDGRQGRGEVKEGEEKEGEEKEEEQEEEEVFALNDSTAMADATARWGLWPSYRLKRDLMPSKRDQRRLWPSYRRANATDENASNANTSGGACACQAQCKGRRRGGGDAGSDGTGGEGDEEEDWGLGEEAGALTMRLPQLAGEDGGEGGGRRAGADAMSMAPTMNLSEALVEISQLGSLVESLAPRVESALAIFGTIPTYKLHVRGSATTSRSSSTQPLVRPKTPKRKPPSQRENAEMVEWGGRGETERAILLATNLNKKGRGGASKEEEEEEEEARGALMTSAQMTQQTRAPLEDIFLGVTAAHRALSGLPSKNVAGWTSGTRSWAAGSFSTWYRALAAVALIVHFLVLLCASLLAYNIAAVSSGRLDSAHHLWVYVGSAVLSAIAWLLLGVFYPLGIVLGGICSAIPSSGAEDNLQLVRVLIPPKMLPMTRRLVDSCLPRLSASSSSSSATSTGTSGLGGSDGRWTGGKDDNGVGRAYMLDVVGLNVELVNATFDAFQLDKQMDIKALSLISLPMDDAKSILLKQISRPLINYTGTACQYFARPACMFQAVQCNSTGFPTSPRNFSAFNCELLAKGCSVPCACCRIFAQVEQTRATAKDVLGLLHALNSTLSDLQRTTRLQLDANCQTCSPPSVAARLEDLRQMALELNASCIAGTYGFGQAYRDAHSSVCLSLQADMDIVWLTVGFIAVLLQIMPFLLCKALSRDAARRRQREEEEKEQVQKEEYLLGAAQADRDLRRAELALSLPIARDLSFGPPSHNRGLSPIGGLSPRGGGIGWEVPSMYEQMNGFDRDRGAVHTSRNNFYDTAFSDTPAHSPRDERSSFRPGNVYDDSTTTATLMNLSPGELGAFNGPLTAMT